MHYLILNFSIALILFACSTSQENEIIIKINEKNEIRIDNKLIPVQDLENVLSVKQRELKLEGVPPKEIVAKLFVHEDARMGVVSALQEALRSRNISKVVYIGIKDEPQD